MYPSFGGESGAYGTYGNLGLYGGSVTYGSQQLTELSPPQSFVEPFPLAEMITYLKLPPSAFQDPAIADEVQSFIVGAREQAEILQNRDLVRKQWDLVYDYWPSFQVLMRGPLVSVDLVRYRDSDGVFHTMIQDTDYLVDTAKQPGVLAPLYNKTWPTFAAWPSSAILIRHTSGVAPNSAWWSDTGARVKIGMKLLVSAWFNKRMPFEKGAGPASEYPFAITSCLSQGAVPRVK